MKLTNWIAIAVDAILIGIHKEVLLAPFAIRTIAVALAVQAMATMSGQVVQMPIEEALVGVIVAVAC